MEEEIRLLLAETGEHDSVLPRATQSSYPDEAGHFPATPGHRVLLVITGGIAAYKALDLIRRLRERGASVRVVMTKAAQEFVTPLAASALADGGVYTDLFDRHSEFDVGHIRLA